MDFVISRDRSRCDLVSRDIESGDALLFQALHAGRRRKPVAGQEAPRHRHPLAGPIFPDPDIMRETLSRVMQFDRAEVPLDT